MENSKQKDIRMLTPLPFLPGVQERKHRRGDAPTLRYMRFNPFSNPELSSAPNPDGFPLGDGFRFLDGFPLRNY